MILVPEKNIYSQSKGGILYFLGSYMYIIVLIGKKTSSNILAMSLRNKEERFLLYLPFLDCLSDEETSWANTVFLFISAYRWYY